VNAALQLGAIAGNWDAGRLKAPKSFRLCEVMVWPTVQEIIPIKRIASGGQIANHNQPKL